MPTRIVAAAAALAMLAVPLPAAADGPNRTVLLTLTGGTTLSQLADSVSAAGGRVIETLGLADSLLVELPAKAVLPAGSAEVPDVAMTVNSTSRTDEDPTTSTYLETIGVEADSNRGAGTTIALVDTGVADVPDLDDVTHLAVKGVGDGDGYGHGTFLAGIIAGEGEEMGVAPGAELLDVKVANDEGETSLSKVLAGLELVAQRDVDVVNLSLTTNSPLPATADPLARALQELWWSGVTVVVAAGNGGPDQGSVGSPGNHPALLTAGALDEGAWVGDRTDDAVAPFSARGSKYGSTKPDLVAPGVSIVSTMEEGSVAHGATAWYADGYGRGSGTSMSAAVVTGAAAAVISANPKLQPNGVKGLLTSTTYSTKSLDGDKGAGAGALDLGAALVAAGEAPTNPVQAPGSGKGTDWGPNETDAAAWAEFAEAWESGDFEAAREAWEALSWQTKQWASRAWMLAVLAESLDLADDDWLGRAWAGRAWAFDEWLGRAWAGRAWAGRAWAFDEWLGRAWAGRAWAGRAWAGRAWATQTWGAGSWAALWAGSTPPSGA